MKKRYTAGADADANAPLLAGCVCVSPARAMVEMEVNQGKASFIDNRELGGNLWVIGGHELRRKGIAGGGGIVRREVAFTLAKAAEFFWEFSANVCCHSKIWSVYISVRSKTPDRKKKK